MKNPIKIICSVFYLGFSPVLPGTLASLAAFWIFYFAQGHKTFILLFASVWGLLGFALCSEAEKIFKKKDAPAIVIDEFFAMLLTLLFVKPDFLPLAAAFIVFRITDILKPWPIKRVEKWDSGAAVMLDDLIAAGYTILLINLFT